MGRKIRLKIRNLSVEQKEIICKEHSGLVASMAGKCAKKYPDADFNDLIQDGILGLLKAAERFKLEKGYKFSTYAVWWIRQSMLRGLSNNSGMIHIPENLIESAKRYIRTRSKLFRTLGRSPSLKEIAETMNIKLSCVKRIKKEVALIPDIVSIDCLIDEDGQGDHDKLEALIEDRKVVSPENSAIKKILIEEIINNLDKIAPEKVRIIFELRFGLRGNRPHTLEEVGKIMNLCRERVRQIIEKNIVKLIIYKSLKRSQL